MTERKKKTTIERRSQWAGERADEPESGQAIGRTGGQTGEVSGGRMDKQTDRQACVLMGRQRDGRVEGGQAGEYSRGVVQMGKQTRRPVDGQVSGQGRSADRASQRTGYVSGRSRSVDGAGQRTEQVSGRSRSADGAGQRTGQVSGRRR